MPHGLYIHIPFCRSKCPYCGFVSVTGRKDRYDAYVSALIDEYRRTGHGPFSGPPRTIYIGGGTPTVLSCCQLRTVISAIDTGSVLEFTIEVNPESFSEDHISALRDLGVNRLSIGAQSFDEGVLRRLGRIHTSDDTRRTLTTARYAEFDSISVDLMFGVPGQTIDIWQKTLEELNEYRPEHISCYSLSIEEDTAYFASLRNGSLEVPSQEETSDMYEFAVDFLSTNGYERYEISNFCLPEHRSLHNESYWNFTTYRGIGVAAHSYDGSRRMWNTADVEEYIAKIATGGSPVEGEEILDSQIRQIERIMLGLRTSRGLKLNDLRSLDYVRHENLVILLDYLVESRLAVLDHEDVITLTVKGLLLADEIIGEIVRTISDEDEQACR